MKYLIIIDDKDKVHRKEVKNNEEEELLLQSLQEDGMVITNVYYDYTKDEKGNFCQYCNHKFEGQFNLWEVLEHFKKEHNIRL